jgi:chromosome segregation ATPase
MNETSSNINTSSDPFLLEFGSSVSVNEDLYRELHKSCQGLDSSLQHTDQEIQRAIRTDGLLKKDLGHATAEMTRIARDCAEEVDSIAINRHTRAQLLHQFENSFMRIIDPQRFYDRNNVEEEKGEDSNVRNGERKETVCTFLHVLSQTRMMLQNSAASNQENNQILSQIQSDLKETSQNISSAEERIRSLEKSRDEAQTEKHARARELNSENQRQMSIKDACHRARHRCGEHAKELVDLVCHHGLANLPSPAAADPTECSSSTIPYAG